MLDLSSEQDPTSSIPRRRVVPPKVLTEPARRNPIVGLANSVLGPTYSSVSGMRKHYWTHYHVWSATQDTVRERTKEEREHQETLKGAAHGKKKKPPTAAETGAKKIIPMTNRSRFPMRKTEVSAAAGVP